ncbi:MAG TPA: PilZ domain-containing protein, partial [Pyrinomonadaceae bacterium]|nr:PilZ domain-containing protein [Pyrinomonadaceae bacterium]
MTSIAEKTERHTERIVLSLPIRVETHDLEYKPQREVTHLESVSEIGAGFYLSRPFEVGQLLFLTIPLEEDLRRYDHDKEQYP